MTICLVIHYFKIVHVRENKEDFDLTANELIQPYN